MIKTIELQDHFLLTSCFNLKKELERTRDLNKLLNSYGLPSHKKREYISIYESAPKNGLILEYNRGGKVLFKCNLKLVIFFTSLFSIEEGLKYIIVSEKDFKKINKSYVKGYMTTFLELVHSIGVRFNNNEDVILRIDQNKTIGQYIKIINLDNVFVIYSQINS